MSLLRADLGPRWGVRDRPSPKTLRRARAVTECHSSRVLLTSDAQSAATPHALLIRWQGPAVEALRIGVHQVPNVELDVVARRATRKSLHRDHGSFQRIVWR
jgi:hypothetical protein